MAKMKMDQATPFLPQEIIRNILICLPVKPLMRFQCVCKQWKSLIKSQSFISDHLYHSTHQTPSLLFQPKRQHKYLPILHLLDREMQVRHSPTLPFFNDSYFMIRSSCNGLLCVDITVLRKHPPSILLCNPATRDVMMLPRTIDVDISECECYLGFGFSSIVNDYKIVRTYGGPNVYRVEVYSLSTGSWKEIDFDDNIKCTRFFSDALTVNGSMFWTGLNLEMDGGDSEVTVSFDIATEEFAFVPMPDLGNDNRLRVYKDKLAIFDFSKGAEPGCVFDVWVLEEDGGNRSWSKIFSCDYSAVGFFSAAIFWRDELVCNICETHELGSEDEDGVNTVLSLLNVSTNEMKTYTTSRCGDGNAGVFIYAESLVPLEPST